jgi:hypothetical protein
MSDVPSGWYPDPQGLADERYHDGTEWTSQTRMAPAPEPDVKMRPQVAHEDQFKTHEDQLNTLKDQFKTHEDQLNTLKDQFKTQRATMHYVRTIAFVAVTLVYTFVMSVIISFGVLITSNSEAGEFGRGLGGFIGGVGGLALAVGVIILIFKFMQAYKKANEWADKPVTVR